jgi:hypothetical protein
MRKIIEFNNEAEMFKARCILAINLSKNKDVMMYDVLNAICRHNVNGIVEDAMRVGFEVQSECCISNDLYRQLIVRLSRLGLITRQKKCYILHPLLANSSDIAKDELLLRIKD